VPEAPAKADTLVTSEDEFAADPANGEIEKRGVTGCAGKACRAPDDLRRALRNVKAECAGEDVCFVRIWHVSSMKKEMLFWLSC